MFAFVVLSYSFFSKTRTPRVWLGRTSPKWPVFCVEWDVKPQLAVWTQHWSSSTSTS